MITNMWWLILSLIVLFVSTYIVADLVLPKGQRISEKNNFNFWPVWGLLMIVSFFGFGWLSLLIHLGVSFIMGGGLGILLSDSLSKLYK